MDINDRVYQSLHLLTRYQWDNKVRLGRDADGGYVVADGLEYDLLLAGGVAGDISFEEDFLQRNPNVSKGYGFDGTVETMPHQTCTNLTLIGKNIGPKNTDTETDLIEYMSTHKDIFLKMDIEGAEFNWILDSEVDFNKFKQMTIEFHPFGSSAEDPGHWEYVLECIRKFSKTHKLIHIHANNIAETFEFKMPLWPDGYSIVLPRVPELTFVRNDQFNEYTTKVDNRPIPQTVDMINFGHIPDVYLFNFPWT